MADYVELDALKRTLEMQGETYADADLAIAITAASGSVDAMCGRRFSLDDEDKTRSFVPQRTRWIEIDDLAEVTSVDADLYDNGEYAVWAATDYRLEPINAVADGMPFTALRLTEHSAVYGLDPDYGTIRVTGRWGWPDLPAAIVEATTILAARLVKRAREAPFGITSLGLEGMAVRVSGTDPDVAMLLKPYARPIRLG